MGPYTSIPTNDQRCICPTQDMLPAKNLVPSFPLASLGWMGRFALLLSLVAFVAAVLPGGIYLGMGSGGFAAVCGLLVYKSPEQDSWKRLQGALATTVGIAALVIAMARFVLTFWAVRRMIEMLS